MTTFSHTSILASAGSGKTYQLSGRYLKLVAENAPVSSILASTFTRAAAGEIRDRILSRLAQSVNDKRERADLTKFIGRDNLSRDQTLDLLELLVKQLNILQIRTLDSFFAAIVRCYSMELELPDDAAIVDGDRAVALRRDAILHMLDERDPQPLINLLRELIEGKSDRGVTETIDKCVLSLHDLYREAPEEYVWNSLEHWPVLTQDKILNHVEVLAEAGEIENFTDKRFIKAFAGDLANLRSCHPTFADDWVVVVSKGLAKPIFNGLRVYFKKDIPEALISAYQPLLQHARGVFRNSIIHRTKATYDLLTRYDKCYKEARRRMRAMTFSDLTAALAQADELAPLEEIYFRLDGRVNHLLLDEMQDTSTQQWRALEPLAEEILSTMPGDRTFFCVGDVKQSIYGWRNACPELMEQFSSRYPVIESAHLDKSWRSSQIIIDTINKAFTNLADNPALEGNQRAAEAWDATFETHTTEKDELLGYVELRTVRRPEEGEKTEHVRMKAAADLVEELHKRSPELNIGVLLRKNANVGRMLFLLGPSERNIPATGRGGGTLEDTPPANVILDLLRLADHPDNTISAFNVLHSPLGAILEFHDLSKTRCNKLARFIRNRIQQEGFANTIDSLVHAIILFSDARQSRRLYELIELASIFDAERNVRCDDFVRYVAATAVSDPVAAPVEVMTIHKSKGLEFNAVILPDLEGKIVRKNNLDVVVEREYPSGPIKKICRASKEIIWSQFDDIAPMFKDEIERLGRESLCLLYVAMTRAKQGLYMLIDPPKKSEKTLPKQLSSILRFALPDKDEQIEPEKIIYQCGNRYWLDSFKPEDEIVKTQEDKDAESFSIELAKSDRVRTGTSLSPSQEVGAGKSETVGDILRLPPFEAFDKGTAIHAMFEQIEWLDDDQPPPPDNELIEIAYQVAPRRGRDWARKQVDIFSRYLESPEIRNALLRNATSELKLKVFREHAFARLTDEGVQQGTIDRLVAEYDGKKCVSATIIDFKTDLIDAEDAQEGAEGYRPQLEAYRTAAAEFLGVDEAMIEMVLLYVEPGVEVKL